MFSMEMYPFLNNKLQGINEKVILVNNSNLCEKFKKNSKSYRSGVIHKITHSNPTLFQSYTLPILHSSNPTLFQSYTL